MSLFARKPIHQLIAEASDTGGLKKTLSAGALVALGIGAVVGAGLFSITGIAAGYHAGPAITISFVIAAVGCGFAGLCYAEFASMIPVAGSAYTYSYATLGEFMAWIIGWDLVLEYAVASATVASSWSGYLQKFLNHFELSLPQELIMTPFETATMPGGEIVHGIINLPAVFLVILISLVLIRGTRQSSFVNNIIVILKITIVLVFIIVGWRYIQTENYTPYIPPNEGRFGEFGWTGILRAAGLLFFAYIGFDAVSTAAQEAKNPKKAMPIGILGTLVICTILYILFGHVLTGVTHYSDLVSQGASDLAPVATAIEHMGPVAADGTITPAFPWLNVSILIAILLGYSSVVLVMLLGQSRVFYTMSTDGLLPKMFSSLHDKYRTPSKSNLFFMVLVSLVAAFVPGRVVGEMTSIGTLFAFILVCIGILVMRKKMPDAPRSFRTPWVPFVPILGVLVCFAMMAFLPLDTWIRLIVWMMVGFDVYLSYGIKKSKLSLGDPKGELARSRKTTAVVGLALCAVLAIVTYIHHSIDAGDRGLIIFSVLMIIAHLAYYGFYYAKGKRGGN